MTSTKPRCLFVTAHAHDLRNERSTWVKALGRVLSRVYDVDVVSPSSNRFINTPAPLPSFFRNMELARRVGRRGREGNEARLVVVDDLRLAFLLPTLRRDHPDARIAVILSGPDLLLLSLPGSRADYYGRLYQKGIAQGRPDLFVATSRAASIEAKRLEIEAVFRIEPVLPFRASSPETLGDDPIAFFPVTDEGLGGLVAFMDETALRMPPRLKLVCGGLSPRYRPSSGLIAENHVHWIGRGLDEADMLDLMTRAKIVVVPGSDLPLGASRPLLLAAQDAGALLAVIHCDGSSDSIVEDVTARMIEMNDSAALIEWIDDASRWTNAKRRAAITEKDYLHATLREREDTILDVFSTGLD